MRRNRSRPQRVLNSPFTLILAFVLLFFLARAAVNIHAKSREAAARLAEEQTTLSQLETNERKITTELSQVSTDAGIKAEIREKYHAIEPGESVAVIVNRDQSAAAADRTSTTTDKVGFWQRFLRFIGF